MVKLPIRFEKKLNEDKNLFGIVAQNLARFEPILKWNKLPFFPEYTDHGEDHLSAVLVTADALIPEASFSSITSADIASLTTAVLLHDLGMHLNEFGFLSMLQKSHPIIPQIDNASWSQLWQDFMAEAKRWDGRKLTKIFGSAKRVRLPPSDPELMLTQDRLLIGEFIRRHHPRLAHEIALHGLPGKEYLRLVDAPQDFLDLSGLIARSHGSSLRTFLGYLKTVYHLQEFQNIHAVYLMAVLRVSDYLQVQAQRAPDQYLKITKLQSPISMGEWKAHSAIVNITTQDDDPEAIAIQAKPTDVKTFLKLRDLLTGLQHEIDSSWAVLGEIYGRREALKNLGLEIRRVKSNIDDLESFAQQVTYIPQKASFETADAELLTLLAEPLYGNNPEHGVRELIQNSVDACLELKDFLRQKPEIEVHTKLLPTDVQIIISGDEKEGYSLVVEDKGIGMNRQILIDYFLRAGASYRRSTDWKNLHESDEGRSRVVRSGRFGIGVLGAFILGDQIEVSTRRINDQKGLRFDATLDADIIELQECGRPVGTTISIRLKPSVGESLIRTLERADSSYSQFGSLPDGLYLLSSPSLSILINNELLIPK